MKRNKRLLIFSLILLGLLTITYKASDICAYHSARDSHNACGEQPSATLAPSMQPTSIELPSIGTAAAADNQPTTTPIITPTPAPTINIQYVIETEAQPAAVPTTAVPQQAPDTGHAE